MSVVWVDEGSKDEKGPVLHAKDNTERLSFRITSILPAFYAVGVLGFLLVGRFPDHYHIGWNAELLYLVFTVGAVISLLLLWFTRQAPSLRDLTRIRWWQVGYVGACVLVAALSLSGIVFTEAAVALDTIAVFCAGCSMPYGMFQALRTYSSFGLRNALLNSSLAFLTLALLYFLILNFQAGSPFHLCAVFLCVGSVASLFRPKGASQTSAQDRGISGQELPVEEALSLRQIVLSIPLAGIAMYSLTIGLTYQNSDQPGLTDEIIASVIAALIMLVFSLIMFRFLSIPLRPAMFRVFGLGLPSLALIALVIKMIPITFVSDTVYLGFIIFYYHLLLLTGWSYLVCLAHLDTASTPTICVFAQVVISVAMLIGMLVSRFGYPFDTAFLGITTASFLLYCVVTLGRNLVLYVSPAETVEDLTTSKQTGIEEVCDTVGARCGLSPREREVLRELAYGHSSSYVAKVLYISNNTARTHMKNIYRKLEINSREDLLELIRKR